MPRPDLPRDDIEAAFEARRELRREMEPAVVDAFADRMERAIEARVDARLAERQTSAPARRSDDADHVLPIVSLGVAIPLTAIASATAGWLAVLIVWLGLVAVNWAYAQRPR